MTDPLETIRWQCESQADAIRWACILEATAPKAGNVFPGRSFPDLRYVDFVTAAEITAEAFDRSAKPFSRTVCRIVESIADQIGSNVNLGILLLLGPLVQADNSPHGPDDLSIWQESVANVLHSLTPEDSRNLYAAIRAAAPGGMGVATQMDLSGPPPKSFLAAMRSAKSRDRIAENYADGFTDLFQTVVPILRESLQQRGDVLAGIADAHLHLLAERPDTLILRKFGPEAARDVQRKVPADRQDPRAIEDFDRFLRQSESVPAAAIQTALPRHPYNPGTTADLIAAALYILLRVKQ
ncbi:triphosphoribosyl-dephospho-CoA synthase [Roseiconus nitratireducens]|uniref:Triphosphoribosyl-dephospho-CoA synthase n=1 Tax=Roseiconus nitratireducens TaxID=2605748 RepID=A0A5M6DCT2_9BACT|nr:triphosphoribosyl-dephospho-CoA synthase [Roseiconus nitratireducens]KAA5545361.1 triphosphoribosyl-dephospho-CoA synthase [Roseiconus nitratireducens]